MDFRIYRVGRYGSDYRKESRTLDRLKIFLQAAEQLQGSGIDLYKEMLPDTPSITEFLSTQLKPGGAVGIDGKMFSVEQVEYMQTELSSSNLQIIFCPDPMQEIWTNRPPMPESPAFVYDIEYAGKSCTEKSHPFVRS